MTDDVAQEIERLTEHRAPRGVLPSANVKPGGNMRHTPDFRARADVVKIIELSRDGRSPASIATAVRLPEEFVAEVLERASEVTEGYKVGEAGEA